MKLCNTINGSSNGGIWRLKWYPTCHNNNQSSSYKLLIGAMHGGCYVYDGTNCWSDQKQPDTTIPTNNNNNIVSNYNNPHRINEFHQHYSMVYGIDWLIQNNNNNNTQKITTSNNNNINQHRKDDMNYIKEKVLWNAAVRYVLYFALLSCHLIFGSTKAACLSRISAASASSG